MVLDISTWTVQPKSGLAEAPRAFHPHALTHLCAPHGPGLALGSETGVGQFSAEAGGSKAVCLEGEGAGLLVQEQIEAINI